MIYIRKYVQTPWYTFDYKQTGRISAEAISESLSAKNNRLSLWRANSVEEIEKEGLLALLGSMESFDTVDIVIFYDDELNDIGLTLKNDDGKTRINSLKNLHTNIVDLDLDLLAGFAHCFASKLQKVNEAKAEIKKEIEKVKQKRQDASSLEENLKKLEVRRYTGKNLKDLLINAIDAKQIVPEELSESFRRNIGR